MKSKIQVIAFYLPQYYSFPENDKWWGEGFTEWTNVKKSRPLYRGHYQPTVPLNENYYCLEDFEVMRWQVEIAKKYGVSGFCFYHYWFGNNRQLMEKPVERFLEHKEVDFPYCLCWANHNWTRTWVGGDKDILMDMQYGDESEWKKHFDYLLPYFMDKRYIAVDGKPVLVIYEPENIPELPKMREFLNKCATENGLGGLTFISQSPEILLSNRMDLMDYCIQYEPNYTRAISERKMTWDTKSISFWHEPYIGGKVKYKIKQWTKGNICGVEKYHCGDFWKYIEKRSVKSEKLIAGTFARCDTTPRRQSRGMVFTHSTPRLFEKHIRSLCNKVMREYTLPYIFVMAWNEWGEGAYLEPDEKYGFRYLEALQKGLNQ